MTFAFSFAGDDIEDDGHAAAPPQQQATRPPPPSSPSAFPVKGKPLLPPLRHDIDHMLSKLPSKVAFSLLTVHLGNGRTIDLPRRELWDVRVQLMAEEDAENAAETEPGLGTHDVKTGIYEGGFKSWESSVDLVQVLAAHASDHLRRDPCVLIELGCGTALPSLALFQWAMADGRSEHQRPAPLSLTVADYNPTVLYLVTLPNMILTWALQQRDQDPALADAFALEGELELTEDVLGAFRDDLSSSGITLSFLSGAWSPEFVELLYQTGVPAGFGTNSTTKTLLIGAETIYSPFALQSFADALMQILDRERQERPAGYAAAFVGAKRLYFGVGGSLDDFVDRVKALGAAVETLHEVPEGVRRGVVRCLLA